MFNILFFTGFRPNFRGRFRDSAGPTPSIDTDTDHSQPVPEDDEFRARPDQAAMKVPFQTFLNASKFRESVDIGIWTQFCPTCHFQTGWTRRYFLSQLLRKQVCCSTWMTRIFAPDRACGGRCLVLEMEISAHVVRCPEHAAVGLGLVIGPGWFRHHQHKLGQTGVGVGEPVPRLLRRDDPSQLCDQVSGVPSQ